MGDAGEGLIDADERIQERMEELARERTHQTAAPALHDPELARSLESLRLARTELKRQLETTTDERRRTQITQAVTEIDRRMAETRALMSA